MKKWLLLLVCCLCVPLAVGATSLSKAQYEAKVKPLIAKKASVVPREKAYETALQEVALLPAKPLQQMPIFTEALARYYSVAERAEREQYNAWLKPADQATYEQLLVDVFATKATLHKQQQTRKLYEQRVKAALKKRQYSSALQAQQTIVTTQSSYVQALNEATTALVTYRNFAGKKISEAKWDVKDGDEQ